MNVNLGGNHLKLFVSTRANQLSVKSDTCQNSNYKQRTCFSDRNYTLGESAVKKSIALKNEIKIVEQKEHKWMETSVIEGSFYNDIIKM
jgi:hypothetical protein